MDKISKNSGVYPTFSVGPIITHSSTRLTIPVAFIAVPLFLFGFGNGSIAHFLQIMRGICTGGQRSVKILEKYVVFLSKSGILCYHIRDNFLKEYAL